MIACFCGGVAASNIFERFIQSSLLRQSVAIASISPHQKHIFIEVGIYTQD